MSRWSRLIPMFGAALLLAGCGSNGADTPLSPAGIRHDEGGTTAIGSNAVDPSTGTTTTTNTATDAPTVAEDTTGRGGTTAIGSN